MILGIDPGLANTGWDRKIDKSINRLVTNNLVEGECPVNK